MRGSWRDLEKWFSKEVFGYESIVMSFAHDYRQAFRILYKFKKWKWTLEYDPDDGMFEMRLNDVFVKANDIPKAIALAAYKYLSRIDWVYEPSGFERAK